ncbi:unnamed protein product [Lymnaea stagnalis]|uniref:Uncharacterized protein n=1 Tax=Lymnaea stagnalis TaxID=6523 RepID=A0AAV2HHV4_LYMST
MDNYERRKRHHDRFERRYGSRSKHFREDDRYQERDFFDDYDILFPERGFHHHTLHDRDLFLKREIDRYQERDFEYDRMLPNKSYARNYLDHYDNLPRLPLPPLPFDHLSFPYWDPYFEDRIPPKFFDRSYNGRRSPLLPHRHDKWASRRERWTPENDYPAPERIDVGPVYRETPNAWKTQKHHRNLRGKDKDFTEDLDLNSIPQEKYTHNNWSANGASNGPQTNINFNPEMRGSDRPVITGRPQGVFMQGTSVNRAPPLLSLQTRRPLLQTPTPRYTEQKFQGRGQGRGKVQGQAGKTICAQPQAVISPVVKEESKEDVRTKLFKFQESIKKCQQTESQPQSILNAAFTESKSGLKYSFQVEPIQTERGVHMYTKTSLLIEDQVFAYSIALSKKESKARVCQKVIEMFIQNDVDKILKEHFVSQIAPEDIPKEIQELIKKHRERNALSKQNLVPTDHEYIDLLDKMIGDLKSPAKQGVNAIMTIDKNCVQLKIKLLAVYKTVRVSDEQLSITCDIYIVDRFIAQGKGPNRKTAQLNAYNKGAELLKNSTGSDVLHSFPNFNEGELKKQEVMDIVYKGYSRMHESNLCRLNRLKQLPEENRKISDLIVIEHEEWSSDRKKHSHCILNQSATQCGCLLEWITEPENGCFRCTMKLQGEEISTCLAKQRRPSVNLASSIALFHLYETQPVVQRSHAEFPSMWCPRSELVTLANTLSVDEHNTFDSKAEVEKKIARAIEKKLDELLSRPTLEEFATAPDWLTLEKKYLRSAANSKGLRVVAEIYCEEPIYVVSNKYDLKQIVQILENQPNKSHGRYRLLPAVEKPSYNDIAGEVAANDSIIREIQGSADAQRQDAPPEPVKEEVESDNQEENSLDSDNEAFVTASNTFLEDMSHKGNMQFLNATSTPFLSDIPLPKSTSTPSRSSVVKEESTPVKLVPYRPENQFATVQYLPSNCNPQTPNNPMSCTPLPPATSWDQGPAMSNPSYFYRATATTSGTFTATSETSDPDKFIPALPLLPPPPPPPLPPPQDEPSAVNVPLEPSPANLSDWSIDSGRHPEDCPTRIAQSNEMAGQRLNINHNLDVEGCKQTCSPWTSQYNNVQWHHPPVVNWQLGYQQKYAQVQKTNTTAGGWENPVVYPTTYTTYSETQH